MTELTRELHQPTDKALSQSIPLLKEKRLGNFLTLTFTLLASVAFGLFAINPTLGTIADLQRQLSDQQDILGKLNNKITVLLELQKSYVSLQNDLKLATTAVPTTPETGQFISLIQGLAARDNVSITHVQLFPVDVVAGTNTDPAAFAFTLDVAGSYTNILAFDQDITHLSRLVTLDTIALATNSDTFRLNLKGKVYFQNQYEAK